MPIVLKSGNLKHLEPLGPVMRLLICTIERLIYTYGYLFLIGLNHHTQTTLTVQILNHVTAIRTVAFRFPIRMKRYLQTSTSTAVRGTVQRPATFSERLKILELETNNSCTYINCRSPKCISFPLLSINLTEEQL